MQIDTNNFSSWIRLQTSGLRFFFSFIFDWSGSYRKYRRSFSIDLELTIIINNIQHYWILYHRGYKNDYLWTTLSTSPTSQNLWGKWKKNFTFRNLGTEEDWKGQDIPSGPPRRQLKAVRYKKDHCCAHDNSVATTWPCFQATKLLFIAILLYLFGFSI